MIIICYNPKKTTMKHLWEVSSKDWWREGENNEFAGVDLTPSRPVVKIQNRYSNKWGKLRFDRGRMGQNKMQWVQKIWSGKWIMVATNLHMKKNTIASTLKKETYISNLVNTISIWFPSLNAYTIINTSYSKIFWFVDTG